MFRKSPALWISAIAILVLLNLVRWAPSLLRGKGVLGRQAGWMHLDFPEPLEAGDMNVGRDLFALGTRPPGAKAARRVAKAAPTPLPAASPTPSSPDGSVLEAAGGYRLMGVVSRGDSSQALIGRGTQLFQVGPGDSLEDRYQVGTITENEVYLTDKQTGNNLKLRIWDQATGGSIPANGGITIHD